MIKPPHWTKIKLCHLTLNCNKIDWTSKMAAKRILLKYPETKGS